MSLDLVEIAVVSDLSVLSARVTEEAIDWLEVEAVDWLEVWNDISEGGD